MYGLSGKDAAFEFHLQRAFPNAAKRACRLRRQGHSAKD
ncbi:hypothetical protein BSU04_23885 [Caballeronia sordidicola]|uniref:Uncharacterized protein n=1 Tax=Caballeronia sordidicola TaxID=196367 RepID=A0A226WZ63_CABSO|nr:hypothetical protein BSU04_23885 [Caballeronia sordidicola]